MAFGHGRAGRRCEPIGCHDKARAPVHQSVFRWNEADDVLQRRRRSCDLGQFLVLELAFDQQQPGAGMVEDIGRTFRTIVEIQGHRDQTQRQRGLVENHPLDAVLQHHRHAIAWGQPLLHQRGLPARHLGRHLRPGETHPGRVRLVELTIGHLIRRRVDARAEQAAQRAEHIGMEGRGYHVKGIEPAGGNAALITAKPGWVKPRF